LRFELELKGGEEIPTPTAIQDVVLEKSGSNSHRNVYAIIS